MQKFRDADIRSFEFNDLKSTHVVSPGEGFQAFSFKELNGKSLNSTKATDTDVRKERNFERKHNFKIDDVVRDSRGLSSQEDADVEQMIHGEVERRLKMVYQDAYNEGLERGRTEGKDAAEAQHHQELSHKIEEFGLVIAGLQAQGQQLMEQSRTEIYEFVKRFTKWIVLKEINEKIYLEQLLEKLILELNARKNIIIKVGRSSFNQMPDVIKTVEARLGNLQNVRIEIVPEIKHPGIILEAENGLIDGSMEGVFKNIDRIFEQMTGSGES